jgi:hypothetical protein
MPMAESIAQLRNLSEADLIRIHDSTAENTVVGTAHYLAELGRRDQQKISDEVLRYTREMDKMTRRITVLTVVTTLATLVGTGKVILDWFLPR